MRLPEGCAAVAAAQRPKTSKLVEGLAEIHELISGKNN